MSNPFDLDSEAPSQKPQSHAPDSVSLAFIFYIVTLAAIAIACIKLIVGNELATWPVVATASFVCAVFGGIAGTVFAYRQSKYVSVLSLGGIIGAMIGIAAGLVSLITTERYLNLMSIAFGGSLALIFLMLMSARFQRNPNV